MIDDDELLKIVRDERVRSLGFDGDTDSSELQGERLIALNYYKRDMSDIPVLENRSSATSSDIADAIHQTLPQLVEIFLEEDVAAFRPTNAQDIDAAQQATDYINHVIFKQNNGFQLLTTAFHDALLLKTGYWTWHWEEPAEPETQDFTGMSELDLLNAAIAQQKGEAKIVASEPQPDGTFNYTLAQPAKEGRVIIKAWPPEDVAVSVDTVQIGDGTYCAFRTRMRRDQLIADGYDADIVAELPIYGAVPSEVAIARDQAGEYEDSYLQSSIDGMDFVEITYHYVKVLDGTKMRTVRVTTGGDEEATLLRKEYVDRVPAASITPVPIPHRHYGQSFADLLTEIQRIRTSLLRLGLDSGYFALNQRYEVSEEASSKHTLTDMLDNIPGGMVRSKSGEAVRPLQAGALNWDVWSAYEAVATAGEQRSGVLRSTMGVNADSLHETKGGMLSMMNSGQLRVRFIARNFAETGFKSLVLGVYDCIRSNATMKQEVRINGNFTAIDPTSWDARDDLDVEICNAGGRDYDIAALQQLVGVAKDIVTQQQGLNGPVMNAANVTYLLRALAKRLGRRDTDNLFADPQQAQQQVQQAAQQPKPDPEAAKAQAAAQAQQAQLQLQAQKQQSDSAMAQQQQQFDQAHAAAKLQADQDRAAKEMQLKQWQVQTDAALQQHKIEQEQATKRWQIQQELSLKAGEISTQAQLDTQAMHTNTSLDAHKTMLNHNIQQQKVDATPLPEVQPGGEGG